MRGSDFNDRSTAIDGNWASPYWFASAEPTSDPTVYPKVQGASRIMLYAKPVGRWQGVVLVREEPVGFIDENGDIWDIDMSAES